MVEVVVSVGENLLYAACVRLELKSLKSYSLIKG